MLKVALVVWIIKIIVFNVMTVIKDIAISVLPNVLRIHYGLAPKLENARNVKVLVKYVKKEV